MALPYVSDFDYATNLVKARLPDIEDSTIDVFVCNLLKATYRHFSDNIEFFLPNLSFYSSPEYHIREHMVYVLETFIAKKRSQVREQLCKTDTSPESGYIEGSTLTSNSSTIGSCDDCFRVFAEGITRVSTPKKKEKKISRRYEEDSSKDSKLFRSSEVERTRRAEKIVLKTDEENLSNSPNLVEAYQNEASSSVGTLRKNTNAEISGVKYLSKSFDESNDLENETFYECVSAGNTPKKNIITKQNEENLPNKNKTSQGHTASTSETCNEEQALSNSSQHNLSDKSELYLRNLTARTDLLVHYMTEM